MSFKTLQNPVGELLSLCGLISMRDPYQCTQLFKPVDETIVHGCFFCIERMWYLVELVELLPLLLCTAASNRGNVQHAITEFNERAPVKHQKMQIFPITLFYSFKH